MRYLPIVILIALLSACGPAATGEPPTVRPTVPLVTPTRTVTISSEEAAIAAAKKKFPHLQDIKQTPPQTIGASTNIFTLEENDGWKLIFWQGSGDCPAGCINHHYWYVMVQKNGEVALAGEYVREHNASTNAAQERGSPMWGIPK